MRRYHMTLKPAGEFDVIFRYATDTEMVLALEFVMRQPETESALFKVRVVAPRLAHSVPV